MQSQQLETPVNPADALETNFGNDIPVEYVAYSRLCPSPLNARTKPLEGVKGLADNICAKGLLQNLVVHPMKGSRSKQSKLGVCAGQRRLAALDMLHGEGRINADYAVPVKIVSEGEARAASLIENSLREPLDPVDLCLAMRQLIEEGRSIDYVAALFTVSTLTVKRRLKLASVSPRLLALLRSNDITLDQITALALADDHDTQQRLWFDAQQAWQRSPQHLRNAITQSEIDASRSRLVQFVGLDAYEAAGGYVRKDLFSDADNAGFITDPELLQRLVAGKLDATAKELSDSGWGWTETRIERDYSEINRFGRIQPGSRAYTRKEQKELKALVAHRDTLLEQFEALSDDDEGTYETGEQLEAALDAANASVEAYATRTETWDAEHIRHAGAFIIVGPHGETLIERGLVKPEDKAALESHGATVTGLFDHADHAGQTDSAGTDSAAHAPKEKPLHGEKLCKRLTAHRTAAVQVELAKRPSMALAVLLHRLVPVVFASQYRASPVTHCVEIQGKCTHDTLLHAADDLQASVAWAIIDTQRQQWSAILPKRLADLLPWLIEQDPGTTLLDLLAFCTASMIDGISGTDAAHPINAISNAVELDMTRFWTPTRARYFDHVSKARIMDVVANAVSPKAAADLKAMKKADAAAAAELRLAKVNWLPEVLTHRELPIVNHFDPDRDDDANEPGSDNEVDEDTDNTVPPADEASEPRPEATRTAPVATPPAWPFPTAATMTRQSAAQ